MLLHRILSHSPQTAGSHSPPLGELRSHNLLLADLQSALRAQTKLVLPIPVSVVLDWQLLSRSPLDWRLAVHLLAPKFVQFEPARIRAVVAAVGAAVAVDRLAAPMEMQPAAVRLAAG